MAADSKAGTAPDQPRSAGPARVVRAEDWSATPARGLAAFSYAPFGGGRGPDGNGVEAAALRLEEERRAAAEALREEELRNGLARELERGRKEGEAVARELFDQAIQSMQAEVGSALRVMREEKSAVFAEFEARAAEVLSFALRRVLGELAGNFPEAVLPLIREAIASVGGNSALIVKVNPADAVLVEASRDFWLRLDSGGEDVRCVSDDRVPRGGCLVVGDATVARADLASLGERLGEAVMKACEERKRHG